MVMMISKLVMMVKTIMMLKMGLMMMMMMAVRFVQIYINVPGGGGYRGVLRISSDGDDRMGTKIKTQKIPFGFLQNLPKSLDQKIPCRITPSLR